MLSASSPYKVPAWCQRVSSIVKVSGVRGDVLVCFNISYILVISTWNRINSHVVLIYTFHHPSVNSKQWLKAHP